MIKNHHPVFLTLQSSRQLLLVGDHTPKAGIRATKKTKTPLESINSRPQGVIKSGKCMVEYKVTLKMID